MCCKNIFYASDKAMCLCFTVFVNVEKRCGKIVREVERVH